MFNQVFQCISNNIIDMWDGSLWTEVKKCDNNLVALGHITIRPKPDIRVAMLTLYQVSGEIPDNSQNTLISSIKYKRLNEELWIRKKRESRVGKRGLCNSPMLFIRVWESHDLFYPEYCARHIMRAGESNNDKVRLQLQRKHFSRAEEFCYQVVWQINFTNWPVAQKSRSAKRKDINYLTESEVLKLLLKPRSGQTKRSN